MKYLIGIITGLYLSIGPGALIDAHADDRWFASVYGGRFSDSTFIRILGLFETNFEDSNIYVLSVGKEIGSYNEHLQYEFEGQVAFHEGMQSHEEINGAFVLRWLTMPWDQLVDTSFAVGNGLSYATEKPIVEILDDKDNEASRLLYYLFAELSFSLPCESDWNVFIRVHHRSGVFGLINDIDSGSNFIGLGIRHYFGQ